MAKKVRKINHESKVENEQLAAVLCYFLIGIIWFFADKKMNKSKLVKFHSKQVINLWLINILVNAIGYSSLRYYGLGLFVSLISLGLLILWVIGLINAANMEEKELPIVGSLAEKYLKF
ncbi:MAG: hypothetical protein ACOCUR_02020 [Nanoarchaeota archaeon]